MNQTDAKENSKSFLATLLGRSPTHQIPSLPQHVHTSMYLVTNKVDCTFAHLEFHTLSLNVKDKQTKTSYFFVMTISTHTILYDHVDVFYNDWLSWYIDTFKNVKNIW